MLPIANDRPLDQNSRLTHPAIAALLSAGSSLARGLTLPSSNSCAPAPMPLIDRDFNGDGNPDLLWYNSTSGAAVVWFLNGTNYIGAAALPQIGDLNWKLEATGDFNGDGKTDILWRNYATGDNALWTLNGVTYTGGALLPPIRDLNWTIGGTGDFNGDGKTDILWRNNTNGSQTLWLMNGAIVTAIAALPDVAGTNLKIVATGDFNGDRSIDILWRNTLSGEVLLWTMSGVTVTGTTKIASVADLNWQIQGAADFNQDGQLDILWRNASSGQNLAWLMNGTTYRDTAALPILGDTNWRANSIDRQPTIGLATIDTLSFSGQEGDAGTFQIRLIQAPAANVTLNFSASSFLTIDADADNRNGTQNTITFTPQDWYLPRTVSFIAEVDGSSASRLIGNTVSYSLSGGLVSSATYELNSVTNTYAPDPTRFNIDLDFRNDAIGFWTPTRRAIAQRAANDWAARIANEWGDFQLNSTIARLDSDQARSTSFVSHRFVDDLVIFMNNYQISTSSEGGLSSPDYEFGGWWVRSADGAIVPTMPRVAQIAISPAFVNYSEQSLYQIVLHEIGHTLGLLGLNWSSYLLQDRTTPQTAVFKGEYSRLANGGAYVPLQSQDGGDYSHPAARVNSIMSYGSLYSLTAPSAIDGAMLADSGYRVYGVNA